MNPFSTIHPFLLSFLRDVPEKARPFPALSEEEWDQVSVEAIEQGLAVILYQRFKRSGFQALPASCLQQLHASVQVTTMRNLLLFRELAAILQACQARNLDCLPLRGMALEGIHGEPMDRPMQDIDLLVRQDALPAIAEMLGAMGYREIDRRPGFARTFSYTLEFFTERHGGILVEPHWTIAYPPFAQRVDMTKVRQRCVAGKVAGIDTYHLSPTDLLLHLCFHLIHKGADAPLLWFYELHCLLRRQGIALDWPEIVRVAAQTGQSLFLAEVLRHLRRLFNTPVPAYILTHLSETALADKQTPARSWLDRRLAHLLACHDHVDGRESFAQLLSLKGLQARLRFVSALLFPSPSFMRFHYHLSGWTQLIFWYVKRVLLLGREGTRALTTLILLRKKMLSSFSR